MSSKWWVDELEIHAIDEDVVCHMYNDKGEKIAVLSLSVEETESVIKTLKKAIKQCKKSEYYVSKD